MNDHGEHEWGGEEDQDDGNDQDGGDKLALVIVNQNADQIMEEQHADDQISVQLVGQIMGKQTIID